MAVLVGLFGLAAVAMAYRFFVGLGPVSNMSDGFAWGIWEPVNVVVFTGIGAGALATGLLTYVLNRGEYHGLVRPAVLLGAICYTLGGSSILVALGRYWNAIMLPVVPFWNLASPLLEVAVCVMAYICVLWLEVLPAILDGAAASRWPLWAKVGRTWGPRLQKVMPFLISAAVVLPVMHQSSLGGLMLIPETKVHPLWHTALLPTLFLVSCLSMGYGAMVALATLLRSAWDADAKGRLLVQMSRINAGLLILYLALRLGDLGLSGKLALWRPDFFGLLLVAELALFVAPAVLLLSPRVLANRGRMFGAALLAIAGGAAYRVDAYLTVFRPAPGWTYFPSVGETVVTVGMGAIGIALFVVISKLFPVVVPKEDSGRAVPGAEAAGAG
jgi:Ni/Fe-hydrogenase subunit HybB-like protein